MEIRLATSADAVGVAIVQVRTWQAAYRGVMPDAFLDTISLEVRTQAWRGALERGQPELWVACLAAEVIGWVAFGGSRDGDAAASTGEIEAIYICPEYWATGLGRALWLKARERLKNRGFTSITLWVLSENSRAIRFYRAAGFLPDWHSEKSISIGGKELKEVRFGTTIG
jgi:ribosomal protein S18 acetylase RimI-like enzyme